MEEGKAEGFDAKTIDLENFDANELAQTELAVFLMATYGEGEPTDNAAVFMKWLVNADGSVAKDFLNKVKFSVFGLGNRQYEHFNKTGKMTDEHLEKLSATRVYQFAGGDDDGTLEEDYDAWKGGLWPALQSIFLGGEEAKERSRTRTSSNHGIVDTVAKVELEFNVVPVTAETNTEQKSYSNSSSASSKVHSSTKHFFTAPSVKLLVKKELRGGGPADVPLKDGSPRGSTCHFEFDLRGSGLSYITADNLAVLPENEPAVVVALARSQGYRLDDWITLEPIPERAADFRLPFPCPCSVNTLLSQYLDIQGILRANPK